MDKEFILTVLALNELERMGYNEVWIGNVKSPHWPNHCIDNFIIASPPQRIGSWPALWSLSEKTFGKKGAGNGLREADQTQRSEVRNMRPGYYKFSDKWERTDV